MARSKIPDPLSRRHLLERELPAAQALAIAEAYLKAERSVEAVDFLRKAQATEQLSALRREAVEAGDVFLLRAAAEAMAAPPSRDEWREAAEAARRHGLERYADEAQRQAERSEEPS